MRNGKKIKVALGSALTAGLLLVAGSTVSANSRSGAEVAVADEAPARPSTIVAIVGPKDNGSLGTIFFGNGVADKSGLRFGGAR